MKNAELILKFMFPVILILRFIALGFIYYFEQKRKIMREDRRERLKAKQEELITRLRNQNKPADTADK